ncbi:MAG: hypothetical protein HKN85_05535 [Gammaproteobacteria bacterium]|nr:hypothetical protein [Gammaproteobacteria bacterium]
MKEFLSYADFTETQKRQIRAAVNDTVAWHREHELPRYADGIDEFEQRILKRGAVPADIDWLFDTLTETGRRFNARSPLLSLIPVMASLDRTQMAQISANIEKGFEESKREREKEAGHDPAERIADGLHKVFRRLGLRLRQNQRARIIGQLRQRQMNQEIQDAIWQQWSQQLLEIMERRATVGFADQFSSHYYARLKLLEHSVPKIWLHDRQLFKAILLELFQSLDTEQIESMHQGLKKVRNVLLELSDRELARR